MQLTWVDWAVIAGFFAVNLAIGIFYARRGGTSMSEYFLSGRNVPWWLAGISMVATTFGADTPLAVSEMVTKNGIAGNWLWWNMVMSGILTVFFFSRLWRRSGVLTDVEFIELRYSGKPAAALRGVRAVYQGLLVNTIIMGWVNLAIAKILGLVLGIPKLEAIGVCLAFTALYVMIGGLWSVLVTDLLQFVVKMSMAIVLAVAAVASIGGIGRCASSSRASISRSTPAIRCSRSSPPATPRGCRSRRFSSTSGWRGGRRRIRAPNPAAADTSRSASSRRRAKRDSLFATLFFNVAHYALRPWPWILVALCALVFYPHGVKGPDGCRRSGARLRAGDDRPAAHLVARPDDGGVLGGVHVDDRHPPQPRRVVPDQRSLSPLLAARRERTALRLGLALRDDLAMVLAALVTTVMDSISGAWQFLLTFSAGVGLVMILRWYWWRINAWSEIAALVCSGTVATLIKVAGVFPDSDPNATAKSLLVTVGVTTAVWLTVTFATAPEPPLSLARFYARVRPNPAGWGPVARTTPVAAGDDGLALGVFEWIAGCGLVYAALFGIGTVILGNTLPGLAELALALACAWFIIASVLRKSTPSQLTPAPRTPDLAQS